MEFDKGYDIHKDPRMINCKTQCGNTHCPYKKYECFAEKSCANYKPPIYLTNADRIRQMTDEELADHFAYYKFICPSNIENSEQCIKECEKCWMNWLKQAATESEVEK